MPDTKVSGQREQENLPISGAVKMQIRMGMVDSAGTMDGSLPVNAGDIGSILAVVDSTCLVAVKPLHHNY